MSTLNKLLKNVQDLVNYGFNTSVPLQKNKNKGASRSNKPKPNPKFWKKLVFFGAFPIIALLVVKSVLEEIGHPHERQEFVPYSYLRIRNKRFPWGDGQRSLFHNKRTNPLPDGYEELDDEEEKQKKKKEQC